MDPGEVSVFFLRRQVCFQRKSAEKGHKAVCCAALFLCSGGVLASAPERAGRWNRDIVWFRIASAYIGQYASSYGRYRIVLCTRMPTLKKILKKCMERAAENVKMGTKKWNQWGSNPWPLACEANAHPSWAMIPYHDYSTFWKKGKRFLKIL